MSSSDSETDSNYSTSSDDTLKMTKQVLDDAVMGKNIHSKKSRNIIRTIVVHVPMIISPILINRRRPHGDSVPGRRYIRRDRKKRHDLIVSDYFNGENSKYTPEHFRRRFLMDISLFKHILQKIGEYDDYFTQKVDATKKQELSPLQKMTVAIRMLAYGCSADLLDEYVQIGESTAIESLKRFCDAIIGLFKEQYLRKPSIDDVAQLLKEGEARGFPGMLGSLDCMHWHWKNYPTAWHGTHTNGFKRVPTLILEVVASQSLWICHAFFGMAGTNNDITVLDRSSLFDDIINEAAPPCDFDVNGHHYNMWYYLSDGIYPQYATLIQTISHPSIKEKIFAKHQEVVRKDVERAFGVLQARWHIVKGPTRMWNAKDLGKIMKTCIILHNMIIESEHSQGMNPETWQAHEEETIENINMEHDFSFLVSRMMNRRKQDQDKRVHKELKTDLINHLWEIYGDNHDIIY